MADEKRGVPMPDDIALDPVQSAIWRDLAPEDGNRFTAQDVPTLRLLCYWHAVAKQAQDAIAKGNGHINIFDRIGTKPYKTDDGRSVPLVRKNPALGVLKEASAEIRALSDQLGISPRSRSAAPAPAVQAASPHARVLSMVLSDREAKVRKAAGA